jgi:hypothetical protein
MTPLEKLQLLGFAVACFYCACAFACHKLWHHLPDSRKVWAIGLWIAVMGAGSLVACALPGYQQGH